MAAKEGMLKHAGTWISCVQYYIVYLGSKMCCCYCRCYIFVIALHACNIVFPEFRDLLRTCRSEWMKSCGAYSHELCWCVWYVSQAANDAHSSVLDVVPSVLDVVLCRWRTCLIVRELELEIDALAQGQVHRNKLKVCMHRHLIRLHLLFV